MSKGKARQPEFRDIVGDDDDKFTGYDSSVESTSLLDYNPPLIPAPTSPLAVGDTAVPLTEPSPSPTAELDGDQDDHTSASSVSSVSLPLSDPPVNLSSSFHLLHRVFACVDIVLETELQCPTFKGSSTGRTQFINSWYHSLERQLQKSSWSNQVLFDPPRPTLDIGLLKVPSTYGHHRWRVPDVAVDETDAIPLIVEASDGDRGVTTHDLLHKLRDTLYIDRSWESCWDDEHDELRMIPCVAYVLRHEWPVIHSFKIVTDVTEIVEDGIVQERIECCRVICHWMDIADRDRGIASARMRRSGGEGSSKDGEYMSYSSHFYV